MSSFGTENCGESDCHWYCFPLLCRDYRSFTSSKIIIHPSLCQYLDQLHSINVPVIIQIVACTANFETFLTNKPEILFLRHLFNPVIHYLRLLSFRTKRIELKLDSHLLPKKNPGWILVVENPVTANNPGKTLIIP